MISLVRVGSSSRRQPLQPGGEPVDRVLRDRQRAVAARVAHRQRERRVDLLRRLHGERRDAAAADLRSARVEVDRVGGVDEIAPVREQPLDAVVRSALLVGGEREDQIALRDEAALPHRAEGGHQRGRAALHVERAAAVEPAVALGEDERIHRPVLAAGLDDVEVREEQHRPAAAGAAPQPRHQVPAMVGSADHDDVGAREAGGDQARRHPLRRLASCCRTTASCWSRSAPSGSRAREAASRCRAVEPPASPRSRGRRAPLRQSDQPADRVTFMHAILSRGCMVGACVLTATPSWDGRRHGPSRPARWHRRLSCCTRRARLERRCCCRCCSRGGWWRRSGCWRVGLARSPRWPAPVRATLATVSVIVAVASVIAYGVGAFGLSRPKAPVFVLGPPITSVVAVVAVIVAAIRARR